MDLRQIHQFIATAEAGSITAAAELLHMSQPPLSMALGKLERELGVTLLERGARGVTLTPEGRYLLAAGQRLLNQRDRVQENLQQIGRGLAGQLRLAVGPIVLTEILGPAIADFIREAPDVELTMSDPAPADTLDRLSSGLIDIAFVATADPRKFRKMWVGEHETMTIGRIPLALFEAASRADPARSVEEAVGRPWLLPQRVTKFPGFHDSLEVMLDRIGVEELPHVAWISTPLMALPLVAADVGVSLLPARWGEQDSRVRIIPGTQFPPLSATMVWRRHSEVSPLIGRFLGRWLDAPA